MLVLAMMSSSNRERSVYAMGLPSKNCLSQSRLAQIMDAWFKLKARDWSNLKGGKTWRRVIMGSGIVAFLSTVYCKELLCPKLLKRACYPLGTKINKDVILIFHVWRSETLVERTIEPSSFHSLLKANNS